jgi:hypothetical protein
MVTVPIELAQARSMALDGDQLVDVVDDQGRFTRMKAVDIKPGAFLVRKAQKVSPKSWQDIMEALYDDHPTYRQHIDNLYHRFDPHGKSTPVFAAKLLRATSAKRPDLFQGNLDDLLMDLDRVQVDQKKVVVEEVQKAVRQYNEVLIQQPASLQLYLFE